MTDYVEWRAIRMKPVGALTVADLRLLAAEIEAANAEVTARFRSSPDDDARDWRDSLDAGAENGAQVLRSIATDMEREDTRMVLGVASWPAPEWWASSIPEGVPAAHVVAVILGWHGVGMIGEVAR